MVKNKEYPTSYEAFQTAKSDAIERVRSIQIRLEGLLPATSEVDWGHVGDLGRINEHLKQVQILLRIVPAE